VWPALLVAIGLAAAGRSAEVFAFEFDTGNPDLRIRWDNSIRANAGWRIQSLNKAIANSPALDQSDFKFENGDMVAQRLDLLSEFDLHWHKKYGFRVSAAGWYDYAYHNTTVKQNPLYAELGLATAYYNNQYSSLTKNYYRGPYGEVLDAFAFGEWSAGSVPIAVKAGRLSTFWGQSAFYAAGIAQSQQPIDGRKGAANPGTEVKELFRPLTQLDVQAQLTPTIAAEAQVYFDWSNTLSPEGGTYLGPTNFVLQGPQQTGCLRFGFVGAMPECFVNFPRTGPLGPSSKQGNWGINFKFNPDFLRGQTVAVFFRQFDEKVPWLFLTAFPQQTPPYYSLSYRAVYARNTKLAGLSYDGSLGPVAIGAEVGYHIDTGLLAPAFLPTNDGPRGDTWHALINGIYLLPRTPIWSTGTAVLELTYDRLDHITKNGAYFWAVGNPTCINQTTGQPGNVDDGCATQDAWGLNAQVSPQWLQVLPSLDVSLPITVQTGLSGTSAISSLGVAQGATTFSVGVQFDYKTKHRLTLEYDQFTAPIRKVEAPGLGPIAVGSPSPNFGTIDRGRISLTYKVSL